MGWHHLPLASFPWCAPPLLSLLQKIVNIERVESPSPHFTLQAVHLEKPCRCSVPTASWLWKSVHMCTQHDCSQRSVMTRTCHFRARHRGGTVKVWKREKVDREKFWNCPFLRSAPFCELQYFQPRKALIPQVSQSTVGKWRAGTTAVSHRPYCSALGFEDYKWIA